MIPAVLFRWAHILAAVVAVGGLVFLRYVLMPAADEALREEEQTALRERLMVRWKKIVLTCITLLLISGFYNFFTISMAKAKTAPVYHWLFGIKFLAALGVFFLASVLTGRSPGFAGMRSAPRRWLSVAAGLALTVILVSGILKNIS